MNNPINQTNFNVIDFTYFNFYGVSPLKDKTNGFMFSCVDKALRIAKDMINKRDNKSDGNAKDTTEYNSLIVFTGDRGSGKSTVMRTFIEGIENSERSKNNDFKIDASGTRVLPIIDPTVFATNERLVGAIVSHIFNEVKKATDNTHRNFEPLKTRRVYECCESVHAALRVVYTGVKEAVRNEIDSLESLDKLTSSTLLQKKLSDLFEAFSDWGEHRTLMIPIDDVDMKVTGNYDLLEEIRSYLFNPHVLVVMSVKFEQLTDSIEQHFTTQLKGLPSTSSALDAQPAEMASKYLLKLVPAPRRVALPLLRPETMSLYRVKLKKEDGIGEPLVDKFFSLIWRKTGIVLVKNKAGSHGLIPTNMRALHHVFNMLDQQLRDVFKSENGQMKMVSCDEHHCNFEAASETSKHICTQRITNAENLEHNLSRIEEWVLDSACSNAVPRGLARIASAFAMHPTDGIHAFLVKELDGYSAKSGIRSIHDEKITQKGLFSENVAIKAMLAPEALPENISIGDALYVLNILERLNPSEGIYHFTSIIKILYSIRMTRATHLYWSKSDVNSDKYGLLREILNGLIYNQNFRLTYNDDGWGPNMEVNCNEVANRQLLGSAIRECLYEPIGKTLANVNSYGVLKTIKKLLSEPRVSEILKGRSEILNEITEILERQNTLKEIKVSTAEVNKNLCIMEKLLADRDNAILKANEKWKDMQNNVIKKLKNKKEDIDYDKLIVAWEKVQKQGKIEVSEIFKPIYPGTDAELLLFVEKCFEVMSRRKSAVAWRLLFFVGVGRTKGRDLHTIRRTRVSGRQTVCYTLTRLRQLKDGEPLFVQLNFMAMFNNILSPAREFSKRVRYIFPGDNFQQDAEANVLLKNIRRWRKSDMFNIFSLSCIDVLDALVLHMNRNADFREIEEKNERFQRGAREFNKAIETALYEVYKRTQPYEGVNQDPGKLPNIALLMQNSPFSEAIIGNPNKSVNLGLFDESDFRNVWGI